MNNTALSGFANGCSNKAFVSYWLAPIVSYVAFVCKVLSA